MTLFNAFTGYNFQATLHHFLRDMQPANLPPYQALVSGCLRTIIAATVDRYAPDAEFCQAAQA